MLVWDESSPAQASQASVEKRRIFEKNLAKEGLELERADTPGGPPLHFIKIHAPDEVLRRYAEILKLRMPMKLVEQDVIDCVVGSPSLEFFLKVASKLNFIKSNSLAKSIFFFWL